MGELGSEVAARWWPYVVGMFGMALIVADSLVFPPPDTATMGAGTACIMGFGAVKLVRFEKAASD